MSVVQVLRKRADRFSPKAVSTKCTRTERGVLSDHTMDQAPEPHPPEEVSLLACDSRLLLGGYGEESPGNLTSKYAARR